MNLSGTAKEVMGEGVRGSILHVKNNFVSSLRAELGKHGIVPQKIRHSGDQDSMVFQPEGMHSIVTLCSGLTTTNRGARNALIVYACGDVAHNFGTPKHAGDVVVLKKSLDPAPGTTLEGNATYEPLNGQPNQIVGEYNVADAVSMNAFEKDLTKWIVENCTFQTVQSLNPEYKPAGTVHLEKFEQNGLS